MHTYIQGIHQKKKKELKNQKEEKRKKCLFCFLHTPGLDGEYGTITKQQQKDKRQKVFASLTLQSTTYYF